MDDSVSFDSFKLTVNGRNLEKRFCKIYGSVFTDYFETNKRLISNANEILNFKKEEVNYNKNNFISYQLAFLLSFSVHDSCLSAQKFYESLMERPEIMRKLFSNEQIKMCSDESESLPTAVGICHVLDEVMEQFGFSGKSNFNSEIRLSVIDERQKWKRLCGCIVDTVNSYFKHVELKLDFVDCPKKRSSQTIIDRIKETDLMIIARVFSEWLPDQVILEAMKENSLLFYFDFLHEPYYKILSQTLPKAQYFFEIKSSIIQYVPFEDLKHGENHLDPPFSWDIDFEPVVFSTWIRQNVPQERRVKMIAQKTPRNQVSPKTSTAEKVPALVAHKPDLKNEAKHMDNLKNGSISLASIPTAIFNVKEIANQPDTLSGHVNGLDRKEEMESSKQCHNQNNISVSEPTRIAIERIDAFYRITKKQISLDFPMKQANASQKKKKTKSSCNSQLLTATSGVAKATLTDSQEIKTELHKPSILNTPTKQTNAYEGKKKTKSSRNSHLLTATSDVSRATLTDAHELETVLHKLSILNTPTKQMNASGGKKKTKSSRKSQLLTATSGVASCIQQEIGSSASFDSEKNAFQNTKGAEPMKQNQTLPSKTSNVSAGKTEKLNLGKPAKLSKQVGKSNATKIFKKKTLKEKNEERYLSFLKENKLTKSGNGNGTDTLFHIKQRKATDGVQRTKKISKHNATEGLKLYGKFARMDLEKKNKDDRHRVRAKQKSFSKYATFDYDD